MENIWTTNQKIKHKSGKQPFTKHPKLKHYKHWKENQKTNNDNKHYHIKWYMESMKSVQTRNKKNTNRKHNNKY